MWNGTLIIMTVIMIVVICMWIYVAINRGNVSPEMTHAPGSVKIHLVTLETRTHLDYLPIHNETVEKYANRHNYTYQFYSKLTARPGLDSIYWLKIQLVQDMLNDAKTYDYVVWLDSDTVVCKAEVPLETFMDKNASIFIACDYVNLPLLLPFCAGVFIIKNNVTGRAFINDVITTYLLRTECIVDGKHATPGRWGGPCYEQGIMNELLYTKYQDALQVLPANCVQTRNKLSTDTVISHVLHKNTIVESTRKAGIL